MVSIRLMLSNFYIIYVQILWLISSVSYGFGFLRLYYFILNILAPSMSKLFIATNVYISLIIYVIILYLLTFKSNFWINKLLIFFTVSFIAYMSCMLFLLTLFIFLAQNSYLEYVNIYSSVLSIGGYTIYCFCIFWFKIVYPKL